MCVYICTCMCCISNARYKHTQIGKDTYVCMYLCRRMQKHQSECFVFIYHCTYTYTHIRTVCIHVYAHTHTHTRAHTTRRRRNLDPQAQLAAGVWEEPYLRKQRDDRQHVPSRVGCLPRKVRGLRMGEFQKMCDPMMLKNQKPAMDPNSKKLPCGFWVALVEDFGFAA